MKIGAIFSDYDGTLCPLKVPRESAFISRKLQGLLCEISRKIPIAIITTKDLTFIKDRVPFTRGVAAIAGLELEIDGKSAIDPRVQDGLRIVDRAYREVVAQVATMGDRMFVERKTVGKGDLAAFCVDWRMARDWRKARRKVEPLLARCRQLGLYVVDAGLSPFADIYVARVDKGSAFLKLKSQLGVQGATMYLGDSEFDNSAFQLADVSIGIRHRGLVPRLLSKYSVEFESLERHLRSLLAVNFNFTPSMLKRQKALEVSNAMVESVFF